MVRLFDWIRIHSLKTEWTADIIYRTRDGTRGDVIQYIEILYNGHRLHSSRGYKNPTDFENNFNLSKAVYLSVTFSLTKLIRSIIVFTDDLDNQESYIPAICFSFNQICT